MCLCMHVYIPLSTIILNSRDRQGKFYGFCTEKHKLETMLTPKQAIYWLSQCYQYYECIKTAYACITEIKSQN